MEDQPEDMEDQPEDMEDQPEDTEDQPEDKEDQPEDKEVMAVREKLVENVSAGASRLILAALNSDWQECFDILKDSKSFEETSSVQETSIKKDTRTIETSAFGCTFLHAAALNKEKGFYIILYLAPHSKGVDNKDLNGDEAIHYAIMVKNLNIAELLLWFRSYEMNLMNLMHLLVEQNRLELAKKLHECWKKDLIKDLDPEGRTVLHLAVEYAGKDMYTWLIGDERFDVNAKSRSGETPLHFALKAEKTDIAEDLVRSGANLKVKHGEDNLLHYCIKKNKLRSVQFVHEHDGQLIKEKSQKGKVAIQIAAQFADLEIFKWLNSILIKSGNPFAPLNKNEVPLIHCAARNQNHGPDIIRFLVDCGANIDRNYQQNTPLHFAIQSGNHAAAKELLTRGANLKKTTRDGQNYLFFCASHNNLDIAKIIHAKDGELIKQFRNQLNVLHYAAETADLNFCDWLVDQGALEIVDFFSYLGLQKKPN